MTASAHAPPSRWQRLSQPYRRLARRERLLALAASAALLLGAGHMLWVAPALQRHSLLSRQMATQHIEHSAVQQQRAQLMASAHDPNAALRAQLQGVRQQLAQSDQEFQALQRALVPPQEMGALLQALLRQHRGLELMHLRSLPVVALDAAGQPLLAGAMGLTDRRTPSSSNTNTTSNTPPAAQAWLYRHSLQVQVQGSYPELLAWVQALETIPRRVQWGELQLSVVQWPKAQMVITLSTLSLDASWWSV